MMLYQDVPEPPDRVAVRYLVAGVDPAERRKCPSVDDFVHRRHVRQVVKVLQHVDPKHPGRVITVRLPICTYYGCQHISQLNYRECKQ